MLMHCMIYLSDIHKQKMPKEAIKYGEKCLAIDTKLGDNSSDRCLNLIMDLITDRHSLDGNDSTIVSLYEEYLERLKDNVTKRFGWMNSEERQSFWEKYDICSSYTGFAEWRQLETR